MATYPERRIHSPVHNYVWDTGTLSWVVETQPAGGGGGAATIADGADVAEGLTTDAAVTSDVNGTVSGKLRGLVKIFANVWDSTAGRLKISVYDQTTSASMAAGVGATCVMTPTTPMATVVIQNIDSTSSNVVCIFEGTVDGTNYYTVPISEFDAVSSGVGGIHQTQNIQVNKMYVAQIAGLTAFRVRQTAGSGGWTCYMRATPVASTPSMLPAFRLTNVGGSQVAQMTAGNGLQVSPYDNAGNALYATAGNNASQAIAVQGITNGKAIPSSVADGSNVVEGVTTDAAVTTNATGTISAKLRGLVSILADLKAGKYYSRAAANTVFSAAVDGVTTSVGTSTTYTGLCVSNPKANTGSLIIQKIGYAFNVAFAAGATIGVMTGNNAGTDVTHTTPVTPKCNDVGNAATPQGKADSAATLPTAPALHMVFDAGLTGAITTNPKGCSGVIDIDGAIVLAPGAYICIYTSTASGASGGAFSITWAE